jgi:hypothetical protein
MRGERLMVRLAHVSDTDTIGKKKRERATFLGEEEGARRQFWPRGGDWFIWFIRSVSFVWFDERERQDRLAHQIDCF